jgi:hypothetical protein
MGLADALIGVASVGALYIAGRKFLAHSVYRDFESRSSAAQILFALVFALSAFMMELLVFEIMGYMDPL